MKICLVKTVDDEIVVHYLRAVGIKIVKQYGGTAPWANGFPLHVTLKAPFFDETVLMRFRKECKLMPSVIHMSFTDMFPGPSAVVIRAKISSVWSNDLNDNMGKAGIELGEFDIHRKPHITLAKGIRRHQLNEALAYAELVLGVAIPFSLPIHAINVFVKEDGGSWEERESIKLDPRI